MSSGPTDRQTYAVTRKTPLDDVAVPAGVVAIGADQHLEVVSAESAFADLLDLAASMANTSASFLVPRSAPVGAPPRAIYKRAVPRDAAEARTALLEMLRSKYDFYLTPLT